MCYFLLFFFFWLSFEYRGTQATPWGDVGEVQIEAGPFVDVPTAILTHRGADPGHHFALRPPPGI